MKKVSEHLRSLGGELYTKAIKNALDNPEYCPNYETDTVLKALKIAFNPAKSKEGLEYWCQAYDKISKEIPDGRSHQREPSSVF